MPRPHASAGRLPRITSIQALRGIAALLVLTTHARNAVVDTPIASGPFLVGSAGHLGSIGASGVDLFFAISGFVMVYSVAPSPSGAASAARFLALRWIRVAPPYYLITLAIILSGTESVTARGVQNAFLFVPWAGSDGYRVPPLSAGWTLSFEFTFYLLVAALVVAGLGRRPWVLAAVLAVLGGIGALVSPRPWLADWFTNPMLLEFALGIGVYLLWRRGILEHRRALWLALGGAGIAALAAEAVVGPSGFAELSTVTSGDQSLPRVLFWGLPTAAILAGALALPPRTTVPRPLAIAGDASYSIYLAHLPAMVLTREAIIAAGIALPADLQFAIEVAVGLAAGLAYYRLVERPLTRVLRRGAIGIGERMPRRRSVTMESRRRRRGGSSAESASPRR